MKKTAVKKLREIVAIGEQSMRNSKCSDQRDLWVTEVSNLSLLVSIFSPSFSKLMVGFLKSFFLT